MHPRDELRTEVSYDVRAWGMDANGKPFAQTVKALNVSRSGARLVGLTSSPRPADVIGVQCGNEKARFRVVWVGKEGTPEQDHIGISAVDEQRWIWGPLGTELQVLRPPNPATSPAPVGDRSERRQQPRYKCNGIVQVRTKGSRYATTAKFAGP
jgi:hypothetical protein